MGRLRRPNFLIMILFFVIIFVGPILFVTPFIKVEDETLPEQNPMLIFFNGRLKAFQSLSKIDVPKAAVILVITGYVAVVLTFLSFIEYSHDENSRLTKIIDRISQAITGIGGILGLVGTLLYIKPLREYEVGTDITTLGIGFYISLLVFFLVVIFRIIDITIEEQKKRKEHTIITS
jgi:uncharacterized membrane protein YhaH (DUF805 family)